AIATEADFFTIKKYNITSGRAFVQQEVKAGAKVIVIGTEVASHFFPGLDPVGRELRIRGTPYVVIGVMEQQGTGFGFALHRFAIAPYTTPLERAIRPRGDFDGLQVQEPSDATLRDAMESAREVLRGARRLQPGRPDNFALDTEDSALAFFGQLKQRLL